MPYEAKTWLCKRVRVIVVLIRMVVMLVCRNVVFTLAHAVVVTSVAKRMSVVFTRL